MADSSDPSLPALLSTAGKIDAVCDQFEREWRAARNPRIEDYLAHCDVADRSAVLRALLEVELELLQSAGEQPDRESYLQRFPQHDEAVRAVLGETSASRAAGDDPTAEATATLLASDVATSRASGPESVSPSASPQTQPRGIGRFEVLQVLGEGAFGTVYRARDPHLDREVAIKLPRENALATANDRARFLREAKIAATLNHPHICPVFEAGEIEGRPYIVMALIEGKTLADLIKSGKPIAPRSAASAVRRIAAALAEAHDKKILHRDLKPSNIMVNRRGEPIVMDFGLARLTRPGDARITHSGQIMGSPAYMSPEQARGAIDEISPASDIYSLGVILYELLCGRRPFSGTVTEVLGQILHVEPPPPSQHKLDLDPALEAICLKAMAKEPAARYGSMRDFAAALSEHLKSQSTIATGSPWTPQDVSPAKAAAPQTETRRRRSAKPRLLAIAALLLVAALAGAAIYRIQTDRGVLVVEVNDPTVEASLRENGLVIHDQASGRRYTIRAEGPQPYRSGTFQLAENQPFRLTVLDDAGLEARADRFTLRRGDEVRVRVTLEPPVKVASAVPGSPALAKPPESPAAPLTHPQPSPLDQLDPKNIPAADRFPWQPRELVAVYGDHRGTHWGAIHALALSPDGAVLATASEDATIGLWDAGALQSVGALTGHAGPVCWVAFTPTGKQLISAGADGTLRLWDLEGRREERKLAGHNGPVRCVAVTPDGARAVSCGDDAAIRLWSLETGQELRTFDKHDRAVWKVCLTADGRRVLSGSDDRTMRYWDLETGEDVVEFENERPGPVQYRAIALSPDGSRAACGWSEGEQNVATMRLFETATGKQIFRARGVVKDFGHGMSGVAYPGSQVFSPDGSLLLSGAWSPADGNALLLWDGKTGELKRKFGGQATGATAVLFSHDGQRAFSGSQLGRVRVWSVETGEDLLPPTGHESFVASVAISSDGRSLLTGGEDLSVRLWDMLSDAQQVYRAAEPNLSYSGSWKGQFAPSGDTALFNGYEYTGRQAELWDVKAWRSVRGFHDEWKESVFSAAFSPDGRQVLAGLEGGLQLWDSERPDQPRRLAGHVGPCTSVAFFPDGRRAVTGGQDKFVRLWDLAEGQELKRIGPLPCVATVYLPAETLCAVSPDGRWVAVSCLYDGAVRLYDDKLEHETPLPGSPGPAAAFSPDSRVLATANGQGQIVFWDLATQEKRREINLPGAVHDLAFDPTGRYLAAANANGAAYLLRLTAPDGRL